MGRGGQAPGGHLDAAESKHVIMGPIFLKYISDSFEELRARLITEQAEGANPEDPDEYRAENVFWVPPEARWSHLQANVKNPAIGTRTDDAMVAIEEATTPMKTATDPMPAWPGKPPPLNLL